VAKKRKPLVYKKWSGNPAGVPEDPERCIESVLPQGRGEVSGQCQRTRGHGPDGLYCRMHAAKYATAFTVWLVHSWDSVTPVQATADLGQWYMIDGRRTKKKSRWETYFPTELEARQAIVKQLDKEIEECRVERIELERRVKKARDQLAKLSKKVRT